MSNAILSNSTLHDLTYLQNVTASILINRYKLTLEQVLALKTYQIIPQKQLLLLDKNHILQLDYKTAMLFKLLLDANARLLFKKRIVISDLYIDEECL